MTVNDEILAFETTKQTPSIRFLASLSDGRTVIQDNRGNGVEHAWKRLGNWIKANPNITITELRLQGPKGVDVKTPANQQGYFFGQKMQAVWRGTQFNAVGIGYYDGEVISVIWHKVPQFNQSYSETRTVANAGFFLIQNLQQ